MIRANRHRAQFQTEKFETDSISDIAVMIVIK